MSRPRRSGWCRTAVPEAELDRVTLELAARIALVGRDLLAANKRVVNQGVELMGRSQLQRFAALNDAVAHRSPEARAFTARAGEVGLKQAVRERDDPFDRADEGPRGRRPGPEADPRQHSAAHP